MQPTNYLRTALLVLYMSTSCTSNPVLLGAKETKLNTTTKEDAIPLTEAPGCVFHEVIEFIGPEGWSSLSFIFPECKPMLDRPIAMLPQLLEEPELLGLPEYSVQERRLFRLSAMSYIASQDIKETARLLELIPFCFWNYYHRDRVSMHHVRQSLGRTDVASWNAQLEKELREFCEGHLLEALEKFHYSRVEIPAFLRKDGKFMLKAAKRGPAILGPSCLYGDSRQILLKDEKFLKGLAASKPEAMQYLVSFSRPSYDYGYSWALRNGQMSNLNFLRDLFQEYPQVLQDVEPKHLCEYIGILKRDRSSRSVDLGRRRDKYVHKKDCVKHVLLPLFEKSNPGTLCENCPKLLKDLELMKTVISWNPGFIKFAHPDLLSDKAFMAQAQKIDPQCLNLAAEALLAQENEAEEKKQD